MALPDPRRSIDTPAPRSVPFPPPQPAVGDSTPGGDSTSHHRKKRAPERGGPGRPVLAASIRVQRDAPDDAKHFPIQVAKLQRPPLRPETLHRDRLLDWLHAKINCRVVLLTSEAGYGKTTLLADFSRRSRLRTLWYRLDEQDRDWIAVMNHLVAAGRQLDKNFAPATGGLLREMGPGGPDRDAIVDTFIRELPGLGPEGAIFIIDDYHLVDGSSEIRVVMREIVARAPDRMTFVFASRRPPSLRLARLRALGELVELTKEDLRFNAAETERLFRESYGRSLEPDVLDELGARTEGWAASLQLVEAAIRDRSTGEIRAFVRGLSGAHGDLYDYLAEEVVGEQDAETQKFLMRTSILQVVDPERVGVVAGFGRDAARRLIETSERLGLLSRRGETARFAHRYHPLVRDFLQDRLRREIGEDGVVGLHRKVATWADGSDWRLAAYHFGAAGDIADLNRVITAAIQTIMSTGEYELAAALIDEYAPTVVDPTYELVRSRMDLLRGDVESLYRRAHWAGTHANLGSEDARLAAEMNWMSMAYMTGRLETAIDIAKRLDAVPIAGPFEGIPKATMLTLAASVDGNLREYILVLERLLERQHALGQRHFVGITALNLGNATRGLGDVAATLRHADVAVRSLEESSRGHELSSALQLRAWALAYQGDSEGAERAFRDSIASDNVLSRSEGLVDWADAEVLIGDQERAFDLLASARDLLKGDEAHFDTWRVVRAQALVRQGHLDEAQELLLAQPLEAWSTEDAHKARKLALLGSIAALRGDLAAHEAVTEAHAFAARQEANLWSRFARATAVAVIEPDLVDHEVGLLLREDPVILSVAADWIVPRLHVLETATLDELAKEIRSRPKRWRGCLRRALDDDRSPVAPLAALILDEIGERQDVVLLRQFARRAKGRGVDRMVGRRLARRLAAPVFVEDQGRVEVLVGDRVVPGTSVRRKVLALLCYLLSRPGFSASRDAILDAMWPDMEPQVAVNSLNQTVYFLRRVFEDPYVEDLSPGYVHHDSDLLWLDNDLLDSRTASCRRLLRSLNSQNPESVVGLSNLYKGRFALDFAYEEWAEAYRDSLHAAYLEVVERAVRADTDAGQYDRAIKIAQAAIEADPEADLLEASLLRLYELSGSHLAAAEQYAHYSSALRRDLGIDPPPLESV